MKFKKGISLIESLLFLLVVLGLTLILITSATTFGKTRGVQLDSIASEIASCEIEELRKVDFSSLQNGADVDIGSPCNADVAKLPTGSTAKRTISDYSGDTDIKLISIVISWTESGATKSVKTDTLISIYGL